MYNRMNSAVDEMIQTCRNQRLVYGIMVSRLRDTHFHVGLNEDVPYGVVEQQDLRRPGGNECREVAVLTVRH
jgi:hypothetical protein